MKKSILFLALGLMMTLGAQAGEKKVYTSYNSGNNTLTYYYDDLYGSRVNVEIYTTDKKRFINYHDQVKKVVIDATMKDTHPSDLSKFFYGGSDGGNSYYLTNLTTIVGMENLNTDEAKEMRSMFEGCKSLKSVDLSHFNTAKVTDMCAMFEHCGSLQSLDLASFNTTKVTTMRNMFSYCESLQWVNLASFETSKVTDMRMMFSDCESLQSLDLSSFHFDPDWSIYSMEYMFLRCSELYIIYCDQDWSTLDITHDNAIFEDCYKLRGEMGTTYMYHMTTSQSRYAHPDEGPSNPGYFTRSGCYAPSGIQLISVTDYTASITWKAPSSQYRWEVNYKPNYWGAETTTKEVTTTSCVLDKLRADYEYTVWIKGYCSETSGAYSPIFLFNAAKCQTPTNVVVSEISSTSAKISWNASFATTWAYVRYYPKNNDAYYNEKTAYGTSCTLTDLTPGTAYYVYVVSECGSSDHMSDASAKVSFTTSDCDTPTDLTVSNITQSSATISWTPGSSSQTKWKVGYYKDQAVGAIYKYKTVTTPSCTLTDLAANTKYGVRVMAVCGDDNVSAMSPAQNFTTLEKPCVAPTNLTISNITQSSATISWTPGNAADDKWVLSYRHENASNNTVRIVYDNSYTLSDLRFNSKYYVTVATYCDEGKYSDETPYKTFTTQPKSASDYVIVSSCAFKGFDPNTVQYGMTWTTEASSAIVNAMSPVDANAVYSLATGGTLYKKNATGGAYTKVEAGNTIEEGIYIYVTMVNILPPESENYRFPKSDEGITVVVNVDDQQWNANPKNYNVTDQLSQITINSPDFTVTAPIPDDPQALADARALLEEMIDNYNYLATMLKELGVGAEIIAAMNPVVASAQAVLDNPNATLTELQDAITTVENEAAKHEQEMLNLLAPYEFEVVKNEAIEHLNKLLLPDDSEDCKKIIEDAKAYVVSLTYNNSKSAQENLDDLDDALRKLYAQIENELEACRSKVGCEPPTDFKVSDVTSTSATLSWQPGSPKQTKYALTVIKMGEGPYWDFEQDIEATSITLTDLLPNTKYEAELEAYCSEGTTDWAAPGWLYFTTLGAQGIEGVQSTEYRVQKILRDGQLFIERNGRTFNAQGAEVR